MPERIRAIAFDAYGTLFDVFSIGQRAEDLFPGMGREIATIWRDKQIEYTRLRTLCDRHADFWQVTREALQYTCALLDLELTDSAEQQLMQQYARLTAFPENTAVLKRLKDAGLPMAILSNGTPPMLESALSNAGLDAFFNHVLSVETVGKFKTAPEAYQLGPDSFGLAAAEILFVSSNGWDVCGASWFGYQTLWLNRHGLPLERLGVSPHHIGSTLHDVAKIALRPAQ